VTEHFFAGLDGAARAAKPRTQGLTMVIDWGMGPHAQEDLLLTGADYCDFAKVAVGVSRLLSNEVLKDKILRYRQHQVEPFTGGQFLEYAEMNGQAAGYFAAVAAAGYQWVEVSDNLAPVELAWKEDMIRQATQEHGLSVLGEVGKKEGLDSGVPMVDDAQACLEAGAEIVLLEAAELIDEATAPEVEEVIAAVGIDKVMFELPGPWIAGVHQHDIHRMRVELIGKYGGEVNIGNVAAVDLVAVEAYRRGLGVNAGGAED
jgi:phosphosulfolactate synthase